MIQNYSSQGFLPELPIGSFSKKELTERKRKGVFYTPERATTILSKWAIKQSDDLVLEPSFGGCGFLVASRDRLLELGNKHPEKSLFGCDIDDAAFNILQDLFERPDLNSHFKKKDFLTTSLDDFPISNVVIGNPPYVSWHNMLTPQREDARSIAAKHVMNGRASLWVYFILHSLSFIKVGGRMAWILPGSFIYSDYSEQLRNELSKVFEKCLAVFLEERIFLETGTEESSVILLCDGYQRSSLGELQFASVRGLDKLENIIECWCEGMTVGKSLLVRPQLTMIPYSVRECYTRIITQDSAHKFAEFADVKIGLVTGANKFFVLNEAQVNQHELPETILEPILAKFSQSRGLELTNEDLQESRLQGQRCLLVNSIRCKQLPEPFKAYLATFPLKEREQNYTFNKTRSIWYQVDDEVRPHGFFSSMQSEGPTLILNSASTTCTNTIYQVNFLLALSEEVQKALAVSVQSTFSQFSAEVEGRTRSGGALKLEPSEAKKLIILLPEKINNINSVFIQVDKHLRLGNRLAAREEADNFLLEHGVITQQDLNVLKQGLQILRNIRSGYRKEATI